MAQVALAKNCPNCGTLVTCGGNFSDVEFYGACPCCSQSVSIANPNAPAINAGATVGGLSVHGACCTCSDEEKALLPAQATVVAELAPEPVAEVEEQAKVSDDDLPYHGPVDAVS